MKTSRTLILVALLSVVLAPVVAAQTPDSTSETTGATNFVRLDSNFASGGVTSNQQFAALRKLGFRTVVNLRTASEPGADLEGEKNSVTQLGFQYFSLPFSPGSADRTIVQRFLQIVKDPANQPVYIHCQSGQRANAFWMIKRVMVDGWTLDKAQAEADTLKLTNKSVRGFAVDYLKAHEK